MTKIDYINKLASFNKPYFVVVQEVMAMMMVFIVVFVTLNQSINVEQLSGLPKESVSFFSFLIGFFITTLFVFLIIKTTRGTKLIGSLFMLTLLLGIVSVFLTLFGTGVAILVFLISVTLFYSNPKVIIFNILLLIGLGGISAFVGFGFKVNSLLIIMMILAVYDIIAVYVTKHMVTLARVMIKNKFFFAVIIPMNPSGFLTNINDVSKNKNFSFLGTGDLVLPALLVASVFSQTTIWPAVIIAIGSVMGLLITNALFIYQKVNKPMPALPPIVLGSVIGYAVSLIII